MMTIRRILMEVHGGIPSSFCPRGRWWCCCVRRGKEGGGGGGFPSRQTKEPVCAELQARKSV